MARTLALLPIFIMQFSKYILPARATCSTSHIERTISSTSYFFYTWGVDILYTARSLDNARRRSSRAHINSPRIFFDARSFPGSLTTSSAASARTGDSLAFGWAIGQTVTWKCSRGRCLMIPSRSMP